MPDEEFAEKLNGIKYKSKKQVDEILDLRKKTLDDIEYKKYLENEAKELKEAEKKLWESESRNNHWVEEQKKVKAEDYKNWWNDALIKRDKPLIEANIKAIKQLEKEYQEGLASFIEKHKNDPFPSVEERVKLYADCARTKYGSSYVSALDDLKWEIKEQTFEGYLKSLYDRTPEAREIFYKAEIKKMNPEQLQMYNRASEVLNSRGAEFDKCELARHIAFDRKGKLIHGILNNKFDNHGEILTHLHAFKFNGALRAGHQVDDIERVILDEGFKTVKPLDEERILYRHVCGGKRDKSIDFINMLMKSKPGDTFVDKGYSYTSVYKGAATSCNGISDIGTPEIQMTIKAPKGARISDGTDFEQREFLFPRNAEFRVIEPPKLKNDNGFGGYYEMLVEYVLPSANKC